MNMILFTMLSILDSLLRADILIWIVAIPIIVTFVVLLYYQVRQSRQLEGELAQLAKVKRHNIEYELVLKAMKMSTWRLDVPAKTITFESDYRDGTDNFTPQQGAPLELFFQQMVPSYMAHARKGLEDLMDGVVEDYHEQYQMRIANSDKTYWEETFATIDQRDLDGRPVAIVGTTMRIDAQKETEQALIEARNHAEESDRLKSVFLANITHEVRTPLNAIVGFSDVLPMVQTEEERNELIKLIKQNNAHLLRLFDDMMNIAKLEAGGGNKVEKSDFDVQGLLREIIDKYTSMAAEKGVEILASTMESMTICQDRDRLKEIINQYVNNAVKFTSAGTITLGYHVSGPSVRFWVKDTGKGIPADKCNEHLFERFVKVDDFVAGTGLGLSICRSLANSLSGKVGVDSELGKGSTFWVELPL